MKAGDMVKLTRGYRRLLCRLHGESAGRYGNVYINLVQRFSGVAGEIMQMQMYPPSSIVWYRVQWASEQVGRLHSYTSEQLMVVG